MIRYAVLNEQNAVTGFSQLSGPVNQPHMVDVTNKADVKVGDVFNRAYENFTRPPPTAPVEPPKISEADLGRKITVNAFRSRFFPEEELAFETRLADSPGLRLLDKRLQAVVATYVNLDDPLYMTLAKPTLVAEGVVTESRADAILGAAVTWNELPERIQQSFVEAGYVVDV